MASTHHSSLLNVDAVLDRLTGGGSLTADELTALAASPDILTTGMLADAVRRRVCNGTVTYVRVALVDAEGAGNAPAIPAAAREVRVAGAAPGSAAEAGSLVTALRSAAGERAVTGFSWVDVQRWGAAGSGVAPVLRRLRGAGLDALAELPIDLVDDVPSALSALADAGFRHTRLTTARAEDMGGRVALFLRLAQVIDRFPHVAAIAPLPVALNPLRPTTGYDDVKAVALARLALPRLPHVQVDWLRYGPKLAQVALTFGADDLDNVTASDESPDGRRRAPLEELRRNVEAAGFAAAERDGRFAALAG